MPYNEPLAERLRSHLVEATGLSQKLMFGGIAFLIRGNMCCGVHKNEAIFRLDPALDAPAVQGLRPMDLTGKPMRGWYMLSADASRENRSLAALARAALTFAASLPSKAPAAAKPKKSARAAARTPSKPAPRTRR